MESRGIFKTECFCNTKAQHKREGVCFDTSPSPSLPKQRVPRRRGEARLPRSPLQNPPRPARDAGSGRAPQDPPSPEPSPARSLPQQAGRRQSGGPSETQSAAGGQEAEEKGGTRTRGGRGCVPSAGTATAGLGHGPPRHRRSGPRAIARHALPPLPSSFYFGFKGNAGVKTQCKAAVSETSARAPTPRKQGLEQGYKGPSTTA